MDERTVAAQIKTHGGNFLAVQWLGLKSCQLCGVAKTKPWRWTASHRFKGEQMSGGKQRRDGRKDGGLIWSWIIGSMVWIRKRLNQKSGDLSSSPTSLLTHLSDGEVRLTWREMWRLKWGRVYEGPVQQLQSSVRAFHSPKKIFVCFFFFCPLLPYPVLYPKPSPSGDQRTTRKASIPSFKSEISKWCPADWIWSTDVFCLANMIFFFF